MCVRIVCIQVCLHPRVPHFELHVPNYHLGKVLFKIEKYIFGFFSHRPK